jgi:hypothetical protein
MQGIQLVAAASSVSTSGFRRLKTMFPRFTESRSQNEQSSDLPRLLLRWDPVFSAGHSGVVCEGHMIHFRTFTAALAYYKPMGYSTAEIKAKLRAHEFSLGAPALRHGQTMFIDAQGRYVVREVA